MVILVLTDKDKRLYLLNGHCRIDCSELLKGNQGFFKITLGQLSFPQFLSFQ